MQVLILLPAKTSFEVKWACDNDERVKSVWGNVWANTKYAVHVYFQEEYEKRNQK